MSSLPFIPNCEQPTIDTIFVTITSSLTLIGCLIVIIAYIKYKQTKDLLLELVFILTVNDLIISIIFLVSTHIDRSYNQRVIDKLGFICSVPDTLLHYFFISSFFWSASIAHTILLGAKYGKLDVHVRKHYYKWYHLISWGTPLILITVLFILRGVKHADCKKYSEIYPHLLFFIPLLACWIFNIVVCVLVTRALRDEVRQNTITTFNINTISRDHSYEDIPLHVASSTPVVIRTSILFLVAFIFCWIWSIIVVFFITLNQNNPAQYFFLTMSYIFMPLQGFLTALIYGFSNDLWQNLKDSVTTHWSAVFGLAPSTIGDDNQKQDQTLNHDHDGDYYKHEDEVVDDDNNDHTIHSPLLYQSL